MRLLRTAGGDVPAPLIRKTLRAQFSPVALAVEADYIAGLGRAGQQPLRLGLGSRARPRGLALG